MITMGEGLLLVALGGMLGRAITLVHQTYGDDTVRLDVRDGPVTAYIPPTSLGYKVYAFDSSKAIVNEPSRDKKDGDNHR